MTVSPSSLAAGNFVSSKNEQFAVAVSVLSQKNVIIGTYDETTFVDIVPNIPLRVYSPADVGGKTGYGFMLHRLARAAFKAGGVETWIIPQPEGGSDPDQATGTIDFTTSLNPVAGTIHLYIAGDHVPVNITADMTDTQIGDAVEAAVNADNELSVTANNVAGIVTFTSKSGGTWGNFISLEFNLGSGEALPTGVAAVIVDLAGGAGVGDIQDALDALGTGDGQNEDFFTNVIHGYGADTATLNALSTYNGVGNTYVGNYRKEIARPFRSWIGDVVPLTAGLNAALVFAGLRRTDRTNGKLCIPGSPNHPQEIAAQMTGAMAVLHCTYPQVGLIDIPLDGVWPGIKSDRWTNDYDSRDIAVKGGLSTTLVRSGIVYLQNVDTFFRPVDIPVESNFFRQAKNISIDQNILYNWRQNFYGTKWQGIYIVEDTAKVTDPIAKQKARDIDSVKDDVIALIKAFYAKGWIYNTAYSLARFTVTLRAGLTGFDIYCPFIPSGEGGIMNTDLAFDTSIAVLLTGGV
jgi:phage tail sheath gpL-like